MTRSTYDTDGCLNCNRCAHLLAQYEALGFEQTAIHDKLNQAKHLAHSWSARQYASEAREIARRREDAREAFSRHWGIHRPFYAMEERSSQAAA
jgi:hypothetical protein